MNTLVVDDIRLSRDGLITLLNTISPEIKIVGSAGTVKDARKLIEQHQLDLIFLDIQLTDGSSFELLDSISVDTKIVFITAYDEHAIDAIHKGAFDYLLKPINVNELRNTLHRLTESFGETQQLITEQPSSTKNNDLKLSDKIGISSIDSIQFIDLTDIVYLKADGKYTEVYTSNGVLVSSKNLKVFELLILDKSFLRVHHSFFLNLTHIDRFKKDDNMLILKNGTEIPVAKSRKDELMSRLNIV